MIITIQDQATAQSLEQLTLWFKSNDTDVTTLCTVSHWYTEKANVGATIHYDAARFQGINYGKNIVQLRFNVCAACFDQGLGLEQAGSGHDKPAIHTV
jgi:hypothetical protein